MKIITPLILLLFATPALADDPTPTPEAPTPEAVTPEAPKRPDVQGQIKAFCADKWGPDYRMQKYCIEKEVEAYREAAVWIQANCNLREGAVLTPLDHIAAGCIVKWTLPNDAGYQWSMVRYCINTQVEAYEALQ